MLFMAHILDRRLYCMNDGLIKKPVLSLDPPEHTGSAALTTGLTGGMRMETDSKNPHA
jgi:hypothetical protein